MDKQLEAAKIVEKSYMTGDFEKMILLLTEDYEHHSFWVLEPMRGKETVIPYYRGKGNAIRKSNRRMRSCLCRISDRPRMVPVGNMNVNGTVVQNAKLMVMSDTKEACVYLEQKLDNGEISRCIAIPSVNEQGMMTKLLITEPSLFYLEPLEE